MNTIPLRWGYTVQNAADINGTTLAPGTLDDLATRLERLLEEMTNFRRDSLL
jgi:hypothetical protein